ncbi:hypothetical protein D3C72_2221690 [compost metagenome]
MPSATISMFRLRAMAMMCGVTLLVAASVPMVSTKDLSIFKASSGRFCRLDRLE